MLKQFYKDLTRCEGRVKQLSKDFTSLLDISVFAYGRFYDDGRASWITSNADQDHFLLESEMIPHEPTFDTKKRVPEGMKLWFCDRPFPGSDQFYKERAKRFQMDHGMILSRHHNGYLENCYFSGLLAKKPLYNLFLQEKELFVSFMDHFIDQLDRTLLDVISEGLPFYAFGKTENAKSATLDRTALLAASGCGNLLSLSSREKECLVLLKDGYTYQMIGKELHLSERTVEHYLESAKNKLGLESRPDLYRIARKL